MQDKLGKGLLGRLVRWFVAPSKEAQLKWVKKNYPGFHAKQLSSGKWWISSKDSGAAFEIDVVAEMMFYDAPIRTASNSYVEMEWLTRRFPGMTLKRIEAGVWDVYDNVHPTPIVRLKLEITSTVTCEPVPA